MRNRNPGIGRNRYCRGNPRHNLKWQPIFLQQQSLFSTTAEYERITALEPYHRLPITGFIHQQLIDILLLHGMIARCLANIDIFGFIRRPLKNAVIRQAVIDHHICLLQTIHRFDADQPVVSRACAH